MTIVPIQFAGVQVAIDGLMAELQLKPQFLAQAKPSGMAAPGAIRLRSDLRPLVQTRSTELAWVASPKVTTMTANLWFMTRPAASEKNFSFLVMVAQSEKAMKALGDRDLEIWNKGNLALINEVYAPDYVVHNVNQLLDVEVKGAAAMKQYVTSLRPSYPVPGGPMSSMLYAVIHRSSLRHWPPPAVNAGGPSGQSATVTGNNCLFNSSITAGSHRKRGKSLRQRTARENLYRP